MKVYALFDEVSDQMGTSKLVGIYDTKELAFANESTSKRCYIQEFLLNDYPVEEAKYIRKS